MTKNKIKITLKMLIFITTIGLINAIEAKEGFKTGPVFSKYGENIEIEGGLDAPEKQIFKVLFDVAKENIDDAPHRGFNSLARFINMHVRAGVPIENIDVALVVHGKASYDLLNNDAFKQRFNSDNPSLSLVSELLENGVKIFVCGQSSSFLDIEAAQLTSGVEMSLSAMTANALLQQKGYTLNPF